MAIAFKRGQTIKLLIPKPRCVYSEGKEKKVILWQELSEEKYY